MPTTPALGSRSTLTAPSGSIESVRGTGSRESADGIIGALPERHDGPVGRERNAETIAGDHLVGRRQLSWPVDDNYLGRLRA